MFQALKNKVAAISTFVAREAAAYKLNSMNIDYHAVGFFTDDLGVVCYDSRGLHAAQKRFDLRFPKTAS